MIKNKLIKSENEVFENKGVEAVISLLRFFYLWVFNKTATASFVWTPLFYLG
jgi:hypothetical protein